MMFTAFQVMLTVLLLLPALSLSLTHDRVLQISSCDGLSNTDCADHAECEQGGFKGEKRCVDSPATPPRNDLPFISGIRGIHVAVNGSNFRTCGAEATPCASLDFASRMATPGDTVYLHGGSYEQPTQRLNLVGEKLAPIVITSYDAEEVRFVASTRIDKDGQNVSLWDSGTAIECSACHHVIFRKLRLDGRADSLLFEDAIKNHYWSDKRIEYVGYSGIQIIDDSSYIEVSDMVIHDMLCSGVYLKGTRYASVKHNIVYRIGHHCMVGGGGLMYGGIGQVPGDYGDNDPDDPDSWRMDYYGNLIFDVEQRLYSWVKKDNTLTMHLDEGKMLDTQGAATDNYARFRIAENLVLFPGVLAMRIKRLPHGFVMNNSIYLETDKYGANGVRVTDNFHNPTFIFSNNAINAGPSAFALDLRGAQPYEGDVNRFHDNYLSGGGFLYAGDIRPGTMQAVIDLGSNGTLFSDPSMLDFSLAPDIPRGVGVSASIYNRMMDMAREYNIKVAPLCHRRDHEKLVQLIINSAPTTDFSNATFVPYASDPEHAEIHWTAGEVWRSKYRKYKNNPLIMHLNPVYALELKAWNHNPLNGYIDRVAEHDHLECDRISGSDYCESVRGCTCVENCDKCANDPSYNPTRDGSTRNLPVSVVPCVPQDQTRRNESYSGAENSIGHPTSSPSPINEIISPKTSPSPNYISEIISPGTSPSSSSQENAPNAVPVETTFVTPETSGKMTQAMLLPREIVSRQLSTCPWKDSDLINWSPSLNSENYTLPENSKVLLTSNATIGYLEIPATSTLVFDDQDIELQVRGIEIFGKLQIGSKTCRTNKRQTITLIGSSSDQNSHDVVHKGIVATAAAKVELFGALYQPSWTRLSTIANVGNNTIYLQECVEWPTGSVILLTTTHLIDTRRHNWNEKVTIASVSCETRIVAGFPYSFGKIVTASRLKYSHYAKVYEYQAEVAILSRNIVIRGDTLSIPYDPQPSNVVCSDNKRSDVPCSNYYLTGYGGHMLISEQASAEISSVEFFRMGQTNQIGRYPIHLHMLQDNGRKSRIADSSVHESFYRGIVIHATNHSVVTRNVAYDIIGHCYYLESGNEEFNEISYNLGAHIHTIGYLENFVGQETETVFTKDTSHPAIVPADAAAAPFYISNLHNNLTGNAAVGAGFSGYSMVSFNDVIDGGWSSVTYVPKNRPTLYDGFYGNSCRSVGWFWNLGPCFYVGGILWKESDTGKLKYIPGRASKSTLKRHPQFENGTKTWNIFVNSRAALCGVAGGDWNVRSKWYNMDVVDIGDRSFNAFGEVSFRNIYLKCRSANVISIPQNFEKYHEKAWAGFSFKGFRSYDTGQKHIISDWIIDCGSLAKPLMSTYRYRKAQIWSFPHGVNINQFQLVIRNISYMESPDPVKLMSYDVGSKDTFSPFFMVFVDADGSMSQHRVNKNTTCVPSICGSSGMVRSVSSGGDENDVQHLPANLWFKLTGLDSHTARGTNTSDERCDLRKNAEYPFWVCDQGKVGLASFEIVPNGRGKTASRSKKEYGRITHWGDTLNQGVPMSGDPQVVGPFEHSTQGGWFLTFYQHGDDKNSQSCPKNVKIDKVQMNSGRVLIIALHYPANTIFTITRRYGAKNDMIHTYTAATSVSQIRRDSTGTKYYFDNTYLYLRLFPSALMEDSYRDAGIYIPARVGGREIQIKATWASESGCGEDNWCSVSNFPGAPQKMTGFVVGPDSVPKSAACPTVGTFWPLKYNSIPIPQLSPSSSTVKIDFSGSPSPTSEGVDSDSTIPSPSPSTVKIDFSGSPSPTSEGVDSDSTIPSPSPSTVKINFSGSPSPTSEGSDSDSIIPSPFSEKENTGSITSSTDYAKVSGTVERFCTCSVLISLVVMMFTCFL